MPAPSRLVQRPMSLPLHQVPVDAHMLEPTRHRQERLAGAGAIARRGADPVLSTAREHVGLRRRDAAMLHQVLRHLELVLPDGELEGRDALRVPGVGVCASAFAEMADDFETSVARRVVERPPPLRARARGSLAVRVHAHFGAQQPLQRLEVSAAGGPVDSEAAILVCFVQRRGS